MIEGLRALPWVSRHREALAEEDDPNARTYLECGTCKQHLSHQQRRQMGCGWIAPAERTGLRVPLPAGAPEGWSCCPGYLITLPGALEALVSHLWWDKGMLLEYLAADGLELTALLRDAIDVLARAENEAQYTTMTIRRREAGS